VNQVQKHQERNDWQSTSDSLPRLHPENGSGKFLIGDPEVSSNSRVLVLAPHLEDPIVGCGGTICKLAKRGAHVKVLYMTDPSCRGEPRPSRGPVSMTKKDAVGSLARLRCYESEYLDLPCMAMKCDYNTKRRLFRAMDYYSPDLLLIPSLHDMHPDNKMAGLLVASTLMEYDRSLTLYSYDVWGGLFPNTMVEISDVLEDKLAAFELCQLPSGPARDIDAASEPKAFRLSSMHEDRHCEPFLRQKRADFMIMAWQLRAYGYIDRTSEDTDNS
jgi:LmbE family N-acetylglucosaminyl deacetylase